MQQAAVAWNVKQDHVAAEKMQKAALKAVSGGKGRPEVVAQVRAGPALLCFCRGSLSAAGVLVGVNRRAGLATIVFTKRRQSDTKSQHVCHPSLLPPHQGGVVPGRHALRPEQVRRRPRRGGRRARGENLEVHGEKMSFLKCLDKSLT
jgi:hypothetical protein